MTERVVTTATRPVTLPTSGSPWKYCCATIVECSCRLSQRLLRAAKVGHHDRKGGHHGKEAGHHACKWVTMEIMVHNAF